MGNNIVKRGNKPCVFYGKQYFDGETLVRGSIRLIMLGIGFNVFGLLGAIIGYFIPNPLGLIVKDYCVCGYPATEHGITI